MRKNVIYLLGWLLLLSLTFTARAFDAENSNSIRHFRAHSMFLNEGQSLPFARHSQQDGQGFIWLTSGPFVQRYNGYEVESFHLPFLSESRRGTSPYLFKDSQERFWVGQAGLFLFDPKAQAFVSQQATQAHHVESVIEDKNGYLWFAGDGEGLFQFDASEKEIRQSFFNLSNNQRISDVHSLAYDPNGDVIWIVASSGIYQFLINTQEFIKIKTELDDVFASFLIRDISLDLYNGVLWVGTFNGLLKIDTTNLSSKLYTLSLDSGMPVNAVTTTFIDANNNTWIGFEKAGMCVYKYHSDSFVCMPASFDDAHSIPLASVEDINQDKDGNLWLSMNSYGLVRVSPELEKFSDITRLIDDDLSDFFPHTFDGELTSRGEIWFATDGGGISIFDFKNNQFSTLKHEPDNPASLGSDSVISLTQDENAIIWAGTWGGGLAKIDPLTRDVEVFQQDPTAAKNSTIGGNNIFVVEADKQGGIWLSVWGKGVQYFDIARNRFTDYFSRQKGGDSDIFNLGVVDLAIHGNYLYIAGRYGLEQLNLKTGQIELVIDEDFGGISHIHPSNNNTLWLATSSGLVKLDLESKAYLIYSEKDGLANNEVNYLSVDPLDRIWAATNHGLSIFDTKTKLFVNYSQQDGLVGNELSTHGEFTSVDGAFYVPAKNGVTKIDPFSLPERLPESRTYISEVSMITTDASSDRRFSFAELLSQTSPAEIVYNNNSLKIDFSALNYVYPQYSRFRYRLLGWQSDFNEVSAQERSASFTNLPAGDYTFEVYASNSNGIWDENGSRFTFTVLAPWWQTWWFVSIASILLTLAVYAITHWRLAANKRSQNELKQKVAEKTVQLQTYAEELENTSNSLAKLNNELEDRVLQRTQELQKEINERREAERKLFHMAFHDSLTELPNREWILQHISGLIEKTKRNADFTYGVMFLDGDRFKQINDTMGHIFGDKLLIACSKRLTSLLHENQYSARLGGDEFTVVTQGMCEIEMETLAKKIVSAFEEPFIIENSTVYFNVSVGLVCCDANYKDVPSVLKNADIAMYHAKESGRSVYKIFDDQMQKQAVKNIEIEKGLRNAISNDQLELVYQPIFNLNDDSLEGFEALIRWQHPEKGLISPADFIPIAEETGLIWDIGEWVLREACRQASVWHIKADYIRPTISINLSSNQLRNTHFLSLLDSVIDTVEIDSRYIKLELTESLLIENSHQLEAIYSCLQERQIDLAIDDFGTGYSSLAYLNEIPVQYLKIDRCFVAAIDDNTNQITNQNALNVLKAIVSLAKGVGKKIIAEGIETQCQLEQLKEFNCDMAQGYFLGRPLSIEKATALVAKYDEEKRKI
uniref:EAL domain-containing protein n=1 Tax=Ningiella ruwaisensis TaxID=2364274 RepID=UPI0010A00A9B|nr:EAL domain-containing protein [Ningiella ruwaisensis]